MKYQKSLFVGIAIAAQACVPDTEIQPSESANTFAALDVPAEFNWQSTKNLSVQFKGTPGDPRLGILRIATSNGDLVLQKLQDADEDANLNIVIPAYVQELQVTFAGSVQDVDIQNQSSFIIDFQ